jgi:hypothetical protein
VRVIQAQAAVTRLEDRRSVAKFVDNQANKSWQHTRRELACQVMASARTFFNDLHRREIHMMHGINANFISPGVAWPMTSWLADLFKGMAEYF